MNPQDYTNRWNEQQLLRDRAQSFIDKNGWTWSAFSTAYGDRNGHGPISRLRKMNGFMRPISMKLISEFIDNCESGKIYQIQAEKLAQQLKELSGIAGEFKDQDDDQVEYHDELNRDSKILHSGKEKILLSGNGKITVSGNAKITVSGNSNITLSTTPNLDNN